MELTNEERQAVYNLRHEKERAMRPALEHLLNVAARYTAWLNKNGAGSTYSTFCDDFGYEAVDNEDLSLIHI